MPLSDKLDLSSHNKIVLAEANELKEQQPKLYKKLKKQVTKDKKNMDRNKTATAIMRALEENSETADLAKTIKAKYEKDYISPAQKKQIKTEAQAAKQTERLQIEQEISANANARWQAEKKFKKSPEGQATKALNQEVMHANGQINLEVKQAETNHPEVRQRVEETAKKAKEEIKAKRNTITQPTQEAVNNFKPETQTIVSDTQKQIQEITSQVVSDTKKPSVQNTVAETVKNTAENTTKGLSKGKCAMIIGTLAVAGIGTWAFLSGKKSTDTSSNKNSNTFNKVA